MARTNREVTVYALSTCVWCKKTCAWLDEHQVPYRRYYVDLAHGEEKERIIEEAQKYVSRLTYPVLVLDGGSTVIQGYQPERFEEELG